MVVSEAFVHAGLYRAAMSRQSGSYTMLQDDEDLLKILREGTARNLVEELRRTESRRECPDPGRVLGESMALVHGSARSVLRGLKSAVEAGIADNYTFHFALTAAALFMERGDKPLEPDLAALREWLKSLDKEPG